MKNRYRLNSLNGLNFVIYQFYRGKKLYSFKQNHYKEKQLTKETKNHCYYINILYFYRVFPLNLSFWALSRKNQILQISNRITHFTENKLHCITYVRLPELQGIKVRKNLTTFEGCYYFTI